MGDTRHATASAERPRSERDIVLAAQQGDGAARAALVAAFTPLVGSVARRYRGDAALERQELMQEGVVGLLRALERFDPDQGTPFWAYAVWWVRQAMQQLVSELARPVVLSDRAARQLARIKHAQASHAQARGREATLADLAHATGIAHAQVASLLAAGRRPRGLHETPEGGYGEHGSIDERLSDPRAEDEFERVPEHIAAARIGPMLSRLSERERTVVCRHFGLHGREWTLRELGAALGVTAERVRQIECEALEKLRGNA